MKAKTNGTGIKVESGIPIPDRQKPGALLTVLRGMKVGESFVYPKAYSLYNIASRAGVKIATRKEGDGVRVWRVE